MKGAAGRSKTGLALSEPPQATLYAPGNIYYSQSYVVSKHLVFLGSGIKF